MTYVFRIAFLIFLLCEGLGGFASEILSVEDSLKYAKFSNSKLLSQARKASDNDSYVEAENIYLFLLQKDSANPIYNYECGLNYFLNLFEQPRSLPYFEKALKYSTKDTITKVYYYLGQAYQLNNRYDEAIKAYSNFKRFVSNNKKELEDLSQKIEQCQQGKGYMATFNNIVNIDNVGSNINTYEAEYVPVVKSDESVMYFTARRKTNVGGEKEIESNRYYEDMFISKGDSGVFHVGERFTLGDTLIKRLRNTGAHESVVSLSYDEKFLITYKNQALWLSEWNGKSWSKPIRFSKTINIGEYQNHGSFSAHNDTLYFSSNARGGYGGLDIYMSVKQTDGKWGKAKNLGAVINTKEDEDSPSISMDDSTLYFSSKGHNSMGGYDVYKSVYSYGQWLEPLNLGMPINSAGDDIYFKYDKYKKQAYFSSSRQRGFGDYDIYRLIDYSTPRFDDCQMMTTIPSFPITFDAKKNVGVKGASAEYHWEFSDGEHAEGEVVTHEFKEPGVHKVKLYILDPIVHSLKEEKDTTITILNINTVHFTSADTLSVDSVFTFNGAPSKIENATVLKYHWSFGDSTIGSDSASTKHKFKSPGSYEVKLSMVARDDSTERVFQKCVTKTVNILNKEEYMNYYLKSVARENKKKGFNSEMLGLTHLDFLAPDTTTIDLENVFDAAPVFIPKSKILAYTWDFGDTLVRIGPKLIQHSYDSIGVYQVKMNVVFQVDSTKGIYERDVTKKVVVLNPAEFEQVNNARIAKTFETTTVEKPKLDFLAPDTTRLSLENIFECKLVTIPGSKILKYEWTFGDSVIRKNSPNSRHTFDHMGVFPVKLNVIYQNKNSKGIYETSVTKNITVIDSANYAAVEARITKIKTETKLNHLNTKSSADFDTSGVPSMELENIYFDFNKFDIRPDAKEALLRNITKLGIDTLLAIKISANTDSRGSKSYNFRLSAKRAISAINFMAQNKISRERIIAVVSKGETNLVNKCGDNVKCSEKEHQLNRRDEFHVVGRIKK
ncbi:MAG: PKD domain-containing protein [Bacteroidetes bacterium]|nr:PKD domain-containing protein [Bacteroidota bacterium]